MVLDDRRQLRGSEATTGDPAWELAVPHAVVATEELTIGLGEISNLVSTSPGEDTLFWLGGILQCTEDSSDTATI